MKTGRGSHRLQRDGMDQHEGTFGRRRGVRCIVRRRPKRFDERAAEVKKLKAKRPVSTGTTVNCWRIKMWKLSLSPRPTIGTA